MVDLVSSCTFNKIDARSLPMFDVEYIFLKIRGKSVGETMNINIICPDDEITTSSSEKVNLDEIRIHVNEHHSNKIDITDNIKLYLKISLLYLIITDEMIKE